MVSNAQKWTGPLQILSLDGGGVKGLFSAAVLANLEKDFNTRIIDHFDLIAGTSTGGIIALGLGLGLSPRESVSFYTEDAPQIFRTIPFLSISKHFIRNKHTPAPLIAALRRRYGERTLGDSCKRLIIPAYDLGRGSVHVFKTPHHERFRRDCSVPAWQIAMATGAAPTYFPAFYGVEKIRLIDGGVWANNPKVEAFKQVDNYAYPATLEEITENELNPNIPRDVDTFEPEPEVNIPAVRKEIAALEGELAAAQKEPAGHLREPGL